MKCREKCGACCIAASISTPFPGMPNGKPGGTRCIHLNSELKCDIYNSPDKPSACAGFKAEKIVCGNNREEALKIIAELEGISFNPDWLLE